MTFLELIVVLGIFGAIAATVLFNYGDFSTSVNQQNLAQDIALQIKRAQTDAVSGKIPTLSINQNGNIGNLVPTDWVPSYGVAFATVSSSLPIAGDGFIYYFNSESDSYPDNNGFTRHKDFFDFEASNYISPCGSNADSECLEEITISSGDIVDIICFDFVDIEPDDDCTDDGEPADRAYISFTRPRSNAAIMPIDTEQTDDLFGNVYIRITSRTGGHKFISVWQSGYINIQ